MRRLLLALVLVALVAGLALGYLGFVPVVATVFGSDRPRDLGVAWTEADLASARAKTSVRLEQLPPGAEPSLVYEGSRPINATFTAAELTALLNSAGTWRDQPVADCQVRINADGTVEGSGILLMDRIDGYAAATGLDRAQVDELLGRFSWVRTNPPFYFRVQAQVGNNRLSGQIYELQIGRMPVPGGYIEKHNGDLLAFMQGRYTAVPGLRADQVTFGDGTMVFRGTLPAVERTAP